MPGLLELLHTKSTCMVPARQPWEIMLPRVFHLLEADPSPPDALSASGHVKAHLGHRLGTPEEECCPGLVPALVFRLVWLPPVVVMGHQLYLSTPSDRGHQVPVSHAKCPQTLGGPQMAQ